MSVFGTVLTEGLKITAIQNIILKLLHYFSAQSFTDPNPNPSPSLLNKASLDALFRPNHVCSCVLNASCSVCILTSWSLLRLRLEDQGQSCLLMLGFCLTFPLYHIFLLFWYIPPSQQPPCSCRCKTERWQSSRFSPLKAVTDTWRPQHHTRLHIFCAWTSCSSYSNRLRQTVL